MIYLMADINKFQRSKDRINEIITYLMSGTIIDEKTSLSIFLLENSIKIIDNRMLELENKKVINN